MTTEQTEAPEWGAPTPPPPNRPKWTVKRIVAAVAIAVGIAAVGGVAIHAASGSITAGPGGGRGGMIIGGPMGMKEGLDHGQFHTGEVTAFSDTSITVRSKDDFTKTYAIDDRTIKSDEIAKGDEVMLVADPGGTAKSIMEEGDMVHRRGGPPPNGGQNGD